IDKSFIFKIDKNQINNSILNRVKKPKNAIFHYSQSIDITISNIKFHEAFICFGDLGTCKSIDNVTYCYYQFIYYKNDLKLENNTSKKKKMTNNNFSSLENINILIKSFINSSKDALPLKHISKLVNDLTNLFNESDYYDMEIEVGENDNIKIFKAHSNILKSR